MVHLYGPLLSVLLLFFSIFPPLARAAPVNVTIDDTLGDPNTGAQIEYAPISSWNEGHNCTACTSRPDYTRAYQQTWHDAMYYPSGTTGRNAGQIPSATANFTGTAVYIYCILTRSSSSPSGNTEIVFILDGERVANFTLPSTGDKTYLYDQIVFSQEGLDGDVQHTIRLESGGGEARALVTLDRIVYTTDDSLVTTTRTPLITWSTRTSQTTTRSTSSSTLSSLGELTFEDSPTSLPSASVDAASSPSTDSSSSSASDSSNTGTIVGATLGSLGGLSLLIGLWWMCARRSRTRDEDEAARVVQPFFAPRRGYGRGDGGSGGGSSARFVGGGLSMREDSSSYHGRTFFGLPAFGGTNGMAGVEIQTQGGRTLTTAGTSSPVTPSTLDTPNSSGSFAYSRMDANPRPYAVNVRSEKMRIAQARNLQNQARSLARMGGRGQRQGNKPNVSPFSPTPLYTPTDGEQNDLVSPSSASAVMSTVESYTQSNSEEPADAQERVERVRRWNSTGTINGGGTTDAQAANDWDDDVNTALGPVSPQALLRPNRRRDPAPLDDRPNTRPNPPLRPRPSRGRPLTQILEVNGPSDVESNHTEIREARLDNGAGSDEGSDVLWQRKLVDIFTPSLPIVAGTDKGANVPAQDSKTELVKKRKGRPLPIPPGFNPPSFSDFSPPFSAEKMSPPPTSPSQRTGSTSTPPPPYRQTRN